jgi:hypothetical protein
MATLSLDVREGQPSAPQTVVVPNNGVVGSYSWDVLPDGVNLSSARLVSGGVELRFTVTGPTWGSSIGIGREIEVRFCNASTCTSANSLRRILPVRVNVLRGLSWDAPHPILFGGLGLPLAEQRIEVRVPEEPGNLEVEVAPVPVFGPSSGHDWLVASLEGTGPARTLRLAVPGAARLPLGRYNAQLRLRYVFASGALSPLELQWALELQVRTPGCRLPESSPGSPPDPSKTLGPSWLIDDASATVRIECWGISPKDASFRLDVPWLLASTREHLGGTEVVMALDPAQASALPASQLSTRELRISSPVQAADTVIPFTLGLYFPDVTSVSPASVRAGAATEVLLSGENLSSDLLLVLYDAQGQPVSGAGLKAVSEQGCDVGGCEVVVAVPPLPVGHWFIGFQQPTGVQRPRGLLRVTADGR